MSLPDKRIAALTELYIQELLELVGENERKQQGRIDVPDDEIRRLGGRGDQTATVVVAKLCAVIGQDHEAPHPVAQEALELALFRLNTGFVGAQINRDDIEEVRRLSYELYFDNVRGQYNLSKPAPQHIVEHPTRVIFEIDELHDMGRWEGQSWHNDATASFFDTDMGCHLWVLPVSAGILDRGDFGSKGLGELPRYTLDIPSLCVDIDEPLAHAAFETLDDLRAGLKQRHFPAVIKNNAVDDQARKEIDRAMRMAESLLTDERFMARIEQDMDVLQYPSGGRVIQVPMVDDIMERNEAFHEIVSADNEQKKVHAESDAAAQIALMLVANQWNRSPDETPKHIGWCPGIIVDVDVPQDWEDETITMGRERPTFVNPQTGVGVSISEHMVAQRFEVLIDREVIALTNDWDKVVALSNDRERALEMQDTGALVDLDEKVPKNDNSPGVG